MNQPCALSSSCGNSRWRERMRRSVVQNATRRAELCATSNRSNGSRVQSSFGEWLTTVSRERSSTMNRLSFDNVLMNWGLVTESRPTSARNWISRKETGETPHGRYRSNQGKLARRFDLGQSRSENACREVTSRPAPRSEVSWTAPFPRPAIGLFYPRDLQDFLVFLRTLGTLGITRLFPTEQDSPTLALDCNYFTTKCIIKQSEPVFSGFGCFHVFHIYNVQRIAPRDQDA